MDTNRKIREHISALGDGELPEADLELAFAALQEPGGREAWDLYHRIHRTSPARRDKALFLPYHSVNLSPVHRHSCLAKPPP